MIQTVIKKLCFVGLFTVAATLCAASAKADMLYGTFTDYPHTFNITFRNASGNSETWSAEESWEIHGKNMDTGQELQFFCANVYTIASQSFQNPNQGQRYTAFSLADSPLSDIQKGALQSLINHTYAHLLNAQDVYASLYDSGASSQALSAAQADVRLLTMALQFSVWEIMHESTVNSWDITSGTFRVSANSNQARGIWNDLVALTNIWLTSARTDTWEGLYAVESFYEVSYFDAGNRSQALIAVTGENPPVVPEPATLALFGLGLAGLGLARRQMKK